MYEYLHCCITGLAPYCQITNEMKTVFNHSIKSSFYLKHVHSKVIKLLLRQIIKI